MDVEFSRLVGIDRMRGEDEEDTSLLIRMHDQARSYLLGFKWCREIKEAYFGLGVGGVVAVFLFRIDAPQNVDEWLWVVVGDVPPAYLVTDDAPTPVSALEIYCELMADWISAVRTGGPMHDVFPVAARPTPENADRLASRVNNIRTRIIPMYE